jgi:hypothetical protein
VAPPTRRDFTSTIGATFPSALLEHIDRIALHALLDQIERTVDDSFGHGLLAARPSRGS